MAADAKAKGKGKRSGDSECKDDAETQRPSAEVLTEQLCEAINGGATARAEDLFRLRLLRGLCAPAELRVRAGSGCRGRIA
eukprot:s720_g25.t1